MMCLTGLSAPAPVILASPVGQPPSGRHSSSSSGPPARWIAPSTPPPPMRLELAALTMASTGSRVISPTLMRIRDKGGGYSDLYSLASALPLLAPRPSLLTPMHFEPRLVLKPGR